MIRAATADDPLRIAVLASGRGSNLAALMERLDPTVVIVGVASNRADAIASRTAVHTEMANNSGGSPVALVARTFTVLP